MKDALLSDLLRKSNINNKNLFLVFYDFSWKYCPDTGRSTGAYNIFYQVWTIDHSTHVPGPVSQSSAENDYNAASTLRMSLGC